MNGKHWFSRNLIPRTCQSSRSIWRHGWWIYVLLMSWTKCQKTPPKNILVTNAGFRSVPRWMQSKGLSIVLRNGGLMTELWQNWMLWRCMKHEVRFGGNTSMPSWNMVTCFNNFFGACVLHKAVLSKKCDKWKRGYYPQSSRKGSTLWFFYPKGELQMFNFTRERLAPWACLSQENINGAWFEHFDIGHFGSWVEIWDQPKNMAKKMPLLIGKGKKLWQNTCTEQRCWKNVIIKHH